MNLFDTFIVQPIFNLLALIYGIIPGGDFGVSLILFTIIVRLAMWPLVKKQLHQTKLMRGLQPELKKIKSKAAGNKQTESQLMMELYRERGVKPFSTFGLLFLQLPIFIALYQVIQIITTQRDRIEAFTYAPIEQLKPIADIINSASHQFNESLLGIVNLSRLGLENGSLYWPVIIIAAIAAGLQYIQSRQITPHNDSKKKLRDVFRDASAGKDVDQAEVSAIMTNRMIMFFPLLTFMIGLYLPGALVLYFAVSSAVAIVQQHILLGRDVQEMEIIAREKPGAPVKSKSGTTVRVITATESDTAKPLQKKSKKKRKKR